MCQELLYTQLEYQSFTKVNSCHSSLACLVPDTSKSQIYRINNRTIPLIIEL